MLELVEKMEIPLVLIMNDKSWQLLPIREVQEQYGFCAMEAEDELQGWVLLQKVRPDFE